MSEYEGLSCNENNIEFLKGQKTATVCFSQPKYVKKIAALKEKCPDEVEICSRNDDGSIVAHIPTSWIKIAPPVHYQLTEEERSALRERFEKVRAKRGTKHG